MAFTITKENRSAFTNFLRSKYEMFTEAEKVNSLPYYLCFDPSDTCQLRCPTCPTGIENESKRQKDIATTLYRADRKKLDIGLFDSVLDELGDNLFLIMFYNYGEPLLNHRLHEYIAKTTEKNIATEVHSNLSLPLSDQRIEELLGAGLGRISASIDGFSQEAYEAHRVGGDVELVKKNIARLAQTRDSLGLDTEIIYKFLIFKHNEHEIEEARQFAEDIGVMFMTGDAFIHNRDWLPSHRENEEPYSTQEQFRPIIERWESAGHKDYFFEHEFHPFWNIVPKEFDTMLPRTCGWHYGFSVITSGGPVAPCCAVSKDKDDFGTVVPGETSFTDIWNNELYTKARMAMAEKPTDSLDHVDTICERCYFPKLVHHLYNNHDPYVAKRFYEVFGASEPEMLRAFELLGDSFSTMDVEGFVAHYEQHKSLIESSSERSATFVAQPQADMSNQQAREILVQFGSLIADLGVTGGTVFEESLLAHSKDDIITAIGTILNGNIATDQNSFAREAALVLAFFQEGAGEAGVEIDSVRSGQITWRQGVEAEMQKNHETLSAWPESR